MATTMSMTMGDAAGAGRPRRYNLLQKSLHWLIALLVVGSFIGGQYIDAQFAAGNFDATTSFVAWAHKTSGFVLLAFMALRVVCRAAFGPPEGGLDIVLLVVAAAALAVWAFPFWGPIALTPGVATPERFEAVMANIALLDEVRLAAVVVAAVALLGATLNAFRGRPRDLDQPVAMRVAAGLAHGGLYAALFLMPLAGWAATSVGRFLDPLWGDVRPPEMFAERDMSLYEPLMQVHGAIGFGLVALVALHVAAALFHLLVRRDGVFRRMWG